MILGFLGRLYPESVKLMHFNIFIGRPLPLGGTDPSNEEDGERGARRKALLATGTAYVMQQGTKVSLSRQYNCRTYLRLLAA